MGYKVFTILVLVGAILAATFSSVNTLVDRDPNTAGSKETASGNAWENGTTASISSTFNDPLYKEQWALSHINLSQDDTGKGGKGVVVAILDTGIDAGHEELTGRVKAEVNFTDSSGTDDVNGHGTSVAGIIAATRNNGKGIAGIAPEVDLLNIKVADDHGLCQAEDVAKGVLWAVNRGADIINISLQIKEPSSQLEKAIAYAWDQGAVIVAAAGNNADFTVVYPACNEDVIAVTALDQDNRRAVLANYGDWVDVAAPGLEIITTAPGNDYSLETGTSFAAAHVSGLAALLFNTVLDFNENGQMNDEVRYYLEEYCRVIDEAGTGKGIINAAASLAAIYNVNH